MQVKSALGKPRPSLFRALGKSDPPETIECDGQSYHRQDIFKHDSWAATAIYQGPAGKIVCKFNRQQSILGIPIRWLGRMLARREAAHYRQLADLPLVPPLCGAIQVNGQNQDHAVAHHYVPGHPLGDKERVNDLFFPRLSQLLDTMHRRGLAYVDLHKRENIIVGDDGRPYLVDFQVSFMVKPRKRWFNLGPWVLRRLQAADRYHLFKHMVKHRPDQYGTEQETAAHRPLWIRMHRLIARPLREGRRRLLVLLGIRTAGGRAQSEHFAEDGLRQEMPTSKAA